ncbi:MAG TPA: hypothetical protein PLB61_06980, partial [Bacteroidales bacterium]|nr:hypothetical protein [Bacteroidales bacterium]
KHCTVETQSIASLQQFLISYFLFYIFEIKINGGQDAFSFWVIPFPHSAIFPFKDLMPIPPSAFTRFFLKG